MIELLKCLRREFIFQKKYGHKIRTLHRKKQKIFICANSAVHGNLGDQALGFCRLKLLQQIGISNQNIIEFTARDEMRFWPQICRSIDESDVILLRGGGFFGNIWVDGFSSILQYIKTFPQNKIIVFPQSVYFTEDIDGQYWLNYSKKIISNANRLIIVARDKKSCELLEKYYDNVTIMCTPDTVLSYTPKFENIQRKSKILICLRNDKERSISQHTTQEILSTIEKLKISYFFQDTVIDYNMKDIEEREYVLNKIWKKFASAELVITDRLHGMIFSTITSTPCIVFDNIDGKVGRQYEWIKNQGYVEFVQNIDELKEKIHKLRKKRKIKYDIAKISSEFDELVSILAEEV